MDLFVVNRLENADEEAEGKNREKEEKSKLDKVLAKIENKRKLREKRNKILKQKKKTHNEIKNKAIEERHRRKQKKALIINLPEVDEFIDKKIEEADIPIDSVPVEKKLDVKKNIEGFTILGVDQFAKKTKVNRVLPKWLTKPKIISADLKNLETKVSSVKQLDKCIRNKLKESGIEFLFPVQAEVIPYLLEMNKISNCIQPQDICVSAPTGSGKTLAFVLPIVQSLQQYTTKKIRALVILPTQDLALQVFKTFKKFTADSKLDVCIITGRSPFLQEQKQLINNSKTFGYLSKVDILICTAGRLVDHLKKTPGFSLEDLEFLVIDEADRVLDNVQNDWLYHLEKHTHKAGIRMLNLNALKLTHPPQKLLFSATLSQDPEKLQKLGLFQPKLFTSIVDGAVDEDLISDRFIGKFTTPKELTEKYIVCSMDLKPLVLYEFIRKENLTKTIVFTHSLDSTHRLKVLLQSLFKSERNVEEISSNLEAKLRNKLIDNFEKGSIDILVCTDALARGIDLAGIKCVISYSAPKHIKTYIHRAGRTARAGEDGLAVTLVHKTQVSKFHTLLKQASKNNLLEITIDEEQLEPLGEQYKDALAELKKTVDEEGDKDLKRIKSAKKFTRATKRKRMNSE